MFKHKLAVLFVFLSCFACSFYASTCTPAGDGAAGNPPYYLVYHSTPQSNSVPFSASGQVGASQQGTCTDCAGVVLDQTAYQLNIVDTIAWNCSRIQYNGSAVSGFVSDPSSDSGTDNYIYVQLTAYPSDPGQGDPIGEDDPFANCFLQIQYPLYPTNTTC